MSGQLLTKKLFFPLFCFGLLGLNDAAIAQVYKSYDDDGNVVFSDRPSAGSNEIEIRNPNLSDSFEIPPPAEPPKEAESRPEPEPESNPQPITEAESPDTNNDGKISRREIEEFRKAQRKKRREAAEAAEQDEQ